MNESFHEFTEDELGDIPPFLPCVSDIIKAKFGKLSGKVIIETVSNTYNALSLRRRTCFSFLVMLLEKLCELKWPGCVMRTPRKQILRKSR